MTTTERKVSLSANRPEKGKSRAEQVTGEVRRSRVGGDRDRLTVQGLDSANYEYRWVKDVSNEVEKPDGSMHLKPGQRILEFQDAGWTFVKKNEVGNVGETNVYSSENMGDIVRQNAGMNEYLFLMKIKKEYYTEDQQVKEDHLVDVEGQHKSQNISSEGDFR